MLRGLGDVTDRMIGILLYYHSRLSEKPRIFLYSQPALVAGLQLMHSDKNFEQVWRRDYFPWRSNHNLTAQGAQTWSLRVLKQLIERCSCLAKEPWPPPQPLGLVAKGEGVCVQCGSFCSSRCKHCLQCPGWPRWREKPGFLCKMCERHNRAYQPNHAQQCVDWKHHFAVAGDDDS